MDSFDSRMRLDRLLFVRVQRDSLLPGSRSAGSGRQVVRLFSGPDMADDDRANRELAEASQSENRTRLARPRWDANETS